MTLDAATLARLRELENKWRLQAEASANEAHLITRTIKHPTDAADRCVARQGVWDSCANELAALLDMAEAYLTRTHNGET